MIVSFFYLTDINNNLKRYIFNNHLIDHDSYVTLKSIMFP